MSERIGNFLPEDDHQDFRDSILLVDFLAIFSPQLPRHPLDQRQLLPGFGT